MLRGAIVAATLFDATGAPAQHTPAEFPGMTPTTLRVMLAALDRRYGSFDRYVRDGLQLSQDDLQGIRSRFLTD